MSWFKLVVSEGFVVLDISLYFHVMFSSRVFSHVTLMA